MGRAGPAPPGQNGSMHTPPPPPPSPAPRRRHRVVVMGAGMSGLTLAVTLRRAGIEVHTAALARRDVTGSHGITVVADIGLDDAAVSLTMGDLDTARVQWLRWKDGV